MKDSILFSVAVLLLLAGSLVQAEESKLWNHESEVSVNIASGNSESESYLAKQKTVYEKKQDRVATEAFYQLNQALQEGGDFAATAQKWEVGLRYERAVSELFSAYANHNVYSDIFAGLIQRNTYGLGGKYWFLKKKYTKVSGELGFQNVYELQESRQVADYNSSRAYLSAEYDFQSNLKGRFWIEHINNFENNEDYQLNFEPSLAVRINSVFSMRVAYLSKFDNVPAKEEAEKLDTIFATSLLAQF